MGKKTNSKFIMWNAFSQAKMPFSLCEFFFKSKNPYRWRMNNKKETQPPSPQLITNAVETRGERELYLSLQNTYAKSLIGGPATKKPDLYMVFAQAELRCEGLTK